jgi:FtsP/CotA-like multicopper oxidase with cupredoxin domain
MVNASVARPYALRFVDPTATLIAVDGMYLREPRPADATVLGPGSRIDVDLVMPDRAGTFEVVEDFSTRPVTLATIAVDGEPVATPDFAPPRNAALPVWTDAAEVDLDIEYNLALRDGRWMINGRSYPDVDPIVIEPGRFTKIRFTNNSIRLHPMHLHGQFFQVLAVNGEPVDLGQFQDSVLLFKDDVVDVGLIAVDEGTWGVHCHILEHAHAGMTTLITVSDQEQ